MNPYMLIEKISPFVLKRHFFPVRKNAENGSLFDLFLCTNNIKQENNLVRESVTSTELFIERQEGLS